MSAVPKVPLAEQLEELEAEWDRRNRDYPLLVARGDLRQTVSTLKQERMAAAINTLAWLQKHRAYFVEYITYATKMGMPAVPDPPDDEATLDPPLAPLRGDFD